MDTVSKEISDLSEEQRDFLIAFCREYFVPTERINMKHSAYGLKQMFASKYFYVSQEQFAQAMEKAGFKVMRGKTGNANFNISERSQYFKHFQKTVY